MTVIKRIAIIAAAAALATAASAYWAVSAFAMHYHA